MKQSLLSTKLANIILRTLFFCSSLFFIASQAVAQKSGCGILADYTYNVGADGKTVTFYNTSNIQTGTINQSNWDISGYPSVGYTVQYTFPGPGEYTVTLTTGDTSQLGCNATKTQIVSITSTCNTYASFFSEPDYQNPFKVNFSAPYAIGNFFEWDFGDNSQLSSDPNPYHIYTTKGHYNVKLKVSDSTKSNCVDSSIHNVTVGFPVGCNVQASLYSYPTQGTSVYFMNYSNGNFTKTSWDFGDGTFSNDFNVEHTYATPGQYQVKITVEDSTIQGCTDTYSTSIYVTQQSNCYLYGSIYGNPDPTNPKLFHFYTMETSLSIGHVQWDFGDGSPIAYGKQVDHLFLADAYYDVKATLIDTTKEACSIERYFYANVGQNSNCSVYGDFYYNPDSVNINKYTFYTYGVSASVTKFEWDFGDNSPIATGNEIQHIFPKPGEYLVKLTLQDTTQANCSIEKSYYVNAGDCGLWSELMFYADSVDQMTIHFNPYSSANANDFTWDFGDGNASKEQYATHKYAQPGSYNISLTLKDLNKEGCTKTYNNYVSVGNQQNNCGIYANMIPNPDSLNPKHFYFNNITTGANITGYEWNFGDNQTSSLTNPDHYYESAGTYYVSLKAISVTGCYDIKYFNLEVGNQGSTCSLYANFTTQKDSVNDLKFTFDASSSNGKINLGEWDFGDGTKGNDKITTHTYSSSGNYLVTLTVSDTTKPGCYDSKNYYVTAGSPCNLEPYFNYYPDSLPNSIQFYGSAYGEGVVYHWIFGDSTQSSAQNPLHVYTKPGFYHVVLNVSNPSQANCTAYYSYDIQVGEIQCNLKANFTFQASLTNNVVAFTDSSTGSNIDSYYWEFGDGDYSYEKNPTHTYSNAGGYLVNLYVSRSQGGYCQSNKSIFIQAGKGGCANLASFQFTSDSTNNKVYFTDKSYGKINKRFWNFGDGTFSSEVNPVHTYTSGGFYYVTLTTSDSTVRGCQSDSYEYVTAGNGECMMYAYFSAYGEGTSMNFYDYSYGNPARYYWNFGDGSTSTEKYPSHTYAKSGYYTVSLTIIDTTGKCTNSYTSTIQAGSDASCQAKFSALPDLSGNSVSFKDQSLGQPDSWFWDFGNGDYSTEQYPSYTYSKGGYYMVTLYTSNGAGCLSSYYENIKVGTVVACQAKFTAIPDSTGKVIFANKSVGSASNNYWYFGDGDYSTDANPVHTYAQPGYYTACLYIWDSNSDCYSEYCETVQVSGGGCKAKFTFMPSTSSSTVSFKDASVGTATEWFWDFGDGSSSNLQNPSHAYSTGGYYSVCLTTYDATSGCSDTYCDYVKAGTGECKASFSTFVDPVTKKVSFQDKSFGNPTMWFWQLGDGQYSLEQSPSYTYAEEGIYSVCLYTYNAAGCMSYACNDVQIGSKAADCEALFETFSKGSTVSFKNTSMGNGSYYSWDFGDNTPSSTLKDEVHTYQKSGYYNVTLTVYNDNGCFNTTMKRIVVGTDAGTNDCNAKFSYMADPATNKVVFKDESYGNPTGWKWEFGGGVTSTDQNPQYTYSSAGAYQVTLTISGNGCSSRFTDLIGIAQTGLIASFSYEDSVVYCTSGNCKTAATYPVSFYGQAYGKPSKWKWSFGDGGTDSLRINPIHTYYNAGSYNACLTISDAITKLTSTKCNIVKVGDDISTGIKVNGVAESLNVFPNPVESTGSVSYNLPQNSKVQISLYDMYGRKLKVFADESQTAGKHSVSFDLTDLQLPAGLYMMNLMVNGKAFNKPLAVKK